MKFIDVKFLKFYFILFIIIFSEIHSLNTEIKLSERVQRLVDKVPSQKLTDPKLWKSRKNYDVIFEKDITKDLSTNYRFIGKGNDDNIKLLNAEILTAKPPSDESENEQEIYPWTAIAASEHRWGWWFWTIYHYPAVNAISGRNWGHWESARGRQDDFWEAIFDKPKKIDVIDINYITLPEFFQIFYKIDDNSQFTPAVEEYHVGEYINKSTGLRTNINLIPKTYAIVFHKPIFAKRIKIVLKKPFFNNYFAINKVRFFQKRSYILIKNELIDYCTNQCFYINTDKPRNNILVESYPCLEVLNLADNRELFIYYNDRSLRLANDHNKCIGFNGAKEIILKTCNDYEPTYAVDFKTDGTLYFHGYESECIYVDGSTHYSENFVNQQTEIIVTSEGDQQTYKKENIKINGNNYWASTPGEKKVSVQILFGKFKNEFGQFIYESKKVDVIRIEWSIYPKILKVFTWKQGGSWIEKKSFNNLSSKHTEVNFTGEQFAAVMFVFEDGYQQKDLGNRIAYGITDLFLGAKSKKIRVGNCKNIDQKFKIFDFDNQSYRKTDKTPDYNVARNKLQNTFTILRTKYYILLKDKMTIPMAQNKGKDMRKILIQTLKKLKEKILEKINFFQFNHLRKIKNTEFDKIINARRLMHMLFPHTAISKQIGTYNFPGKDCLAIKKAKKSGISGWYFIKPECSSKPLRVFCDFSVKKDAFDIFVFNDENDFPNPNISYLKIQKPADIRYYCAKNGLYPIKLHSAKMVTRVAQVLKLMDYDLNLPIAIPLGYDYNCDLNKSCSGFYKSLDDLQSTMINSFFEKGASKLANNGKFIGLGFSDKQDFVTYDLTNKMNIGALICSTNHFETDISDSMEKKISCTTSVAGNGDLFPQNNNVLVTCPMDCDKLPGVVRGNGFYHSSSNVCLSAMHSGSIGKAGGKINVYITGPQKEYKGGSKNGIESQDYNESDSLSSFSIGNYVPNCPIDSFKNDASYGKDAVDQMDIDTSFVETIQKVQLVKSKSDPLSNFVFLEENEEENEKFFPDVKKLASQAVSSAKDMMNKGVSGLTDMAKKATDQAGQIKDRAMDFLNNAKDKAQSFAGDVTGKLGDLLKNKDENLQNQIKQQQQAGEDTTQVEAKNELNQESNKCAPNTDLGRKVLRTRREESDWSYFQYINKKNEHIKLELDNFNKAMSWSQKSSPISNYKINFLFGFVERFRNKLLKLIKRGLAKAEGRTFRTKGIFRRLEDEYYKLIERDDYKLGYNDRENLFKKEWKIFDFVNSKKISSKWDIFTAEINNRQRAIGMTNNISKSNFPGATYFELNKKRFYDFELTVDILFKSIGVAGIAFRYRDPYNYYALIINRKKSYKEVVRVISGEKHIIKKIDDGGILINSWHSVKIRSEGDRFHIFIYDAEQTTRANSEKVIEFSDSNMASGTIAMFTNKLDSFYFDKFEIKAMPCWSAWKPKDDLSIITNTANVYTETFRGNFDDNYEIVDPNEVRDGPSMWSMITKSTDFQDLSIIQESSIYDTSSLRLGSLILLKNKFIHNGILRAEFVPKNDSGVISIIFKYVRVKTETSSSESYYSFDLVNAGDITKNQFILRRIENGLSKELVAINDYRDIEGQPKITLGYRTHIPHLVQIHVENSRITISISINSRKFETIMTTNDDSIKLGQVGFGTFHSKCDLISFELRPPNFVFGAEKVEDFVKNGNDELALNPYVLSSDIGKEGDGGNDSSGNNNSKSRHSNSSDPVWKGCVLNNTTEKRQLYCKERFKNEFKRTKCQASFCDTCCKSNVFWMHSNTEHTCLKKCHKATTGEKSEDYNDVCINSENPDKNIYSYCQSKFTEAPIIETCKLDMCNLCCVNINALKKKKHNYTTIRSCFSTCAKSKK